MLRGSPAESPSDEQLAQQAQAGCAASFEQLVRRYQVPVLHFLRHRASAADVEDLAQETFVRAFEKLEHYSPSWRFAAWLFTIARRVSINHYRRARPTTDSSSLEQLEGNAAEPHQVAIREETRRGLWAAAADVLSEEQMTAVWLYYVEDLPVEQIAKILKRSRAAVKTMMFRARRKLLPLMQEREFDEGLSQRVATRAAAEVAHD